MARDPGDTKPLPGAVPVTWWAPYVGLPFGDGPGEVTCWSLVRRVYREVCGIELPAYGEETAAYLAALARTACDVGAGGCIRGEAIGARRAIAARMGEAEIRAAWTEAASPAAFDVVRMTAAHRGGVAHVGVMVDGARVLHVEEKTGAVVVPVSHYTVAPRVIDFRRYSL